MFSNHHERDITVSLTHDIESYKTEIVYRLSRYRYAEVVKILARNKQTTNLYLFNGKNVIASNNNVLESLY